LAAARIQSRELAATKEYRLRLEAAAPIDPGAHLCRIGGRDDARGRFRRGILPPLPVDPSRSVETQHGTRRDADALARNGAQHQRAGRETRPVNDDPLAGLPDRLEKRQVRPAPPPGTSKNPHRGKGGRGGRENEEDKNRRDHSSSHGKSSAVSPHWPTLEAMECSSWTGLSTAQRETSSRTM